MTDEHRAPTREDLIVISAYSTAFDSPDFVVGEWIAPRPQDSGEIIVGGWIGSDAVEDWHRDLYEHHVIDPDSDYLSDEMVALARRLIASPAGVADLDLPTLRTVMTFLVRAERHSGGGWFEDAFNTGFAQAATRRLGEFAK